jgi:membrane protease YdiL (CAAX protease family)
MSQQGSEQISSGVSPRTLAIWEIASVFVSGLLAEWFVLAFAGKNRWAALIPLVTALCLMISSHRYYRESCKDLGFRFDNFLAACRLLLIPTLVALVVIFLVSWWLSGSINIKPFRIRFVFLPLWALFQQYALQGYIHRRAQLVTGQTWLTVLIVATLFAILHLPNLPVAGLTFVGGAIWAAVYQRHPNLFAIALSHSLASLSLALLLPANTIDSLRVGFKFFG